MCLAQATLEEALAECLFALQSFGQVGHRAHPGVEVRLDSPLSPVFLTMPSPVAQMSHMTGSLSFPVEGSQLVSDQAKHLYSGLGMDMVPAIHCFVCAAGVDRLDKEVTEQDIGLWQQIPDCVDCQLRGQVMSQIPICEFVEAQRWETCDPSAWS